MNVATTMNALIIYDEFAWLHEANNVLQRVAWNANARVSWEIQPWHINVLRFPRAADRALADAVRADLMVFAGLRTDFPTAWLEEWLQRWVMHREVEDAALVMMNRKGAGGLVVPIAPWLSQFTAHHGLVLISNDADTNRTTLNRTAVVHGCHESAHSWCQNQ